VAADQALSGVTARVSTASADGPIHASALKATAGHSHMSLSPCIFVQIRCRPGTTYRVADEIALKEIHSELYSTSGDYDLLMKLYIPDGEDVGKFINDRLLDIDGIERSLTTLTFKAF
jgi:DNA-binding Lrp family transcriptional regulator